MSISWEDIFLDINEFDVRRVLEQWAPLVSGPLQPIGMSAFGDVYFIRPDETVHVLDVLEGQLKQVAPNQAEFAACMNSKEWQEGNLLPGVVWQLHNRGIKRAPGQVFGFVPHPAFAGKIDPERAMPLDAVVWHSICSQSVGPQAKD